MAERAVTRPIVVGVSDSPSWSHPIDWAAPEAVRGGYRLRLVHAEPGSLLRVARTGTGPGQRDEVAELLARGAEEARAVAPGVRVETAAITGNPVSALLAEGQDAAYLVVGAGHTGLLGPAALQLAQQATCPVVVARPTPRRTGLLVVGVDASDEAAVALRLAAAEADQRGSDLLVVHATRSDENEAHAVLDAAVARVAALAPDVRVTGRLTRTAPADALVEASTDADLVIVGSRGVGGLRGALLGSVAQDVLHHAHCPVAVIHRRQRPSGNTRPGKPGRPSRSNR